MWLKSGQQTAATLCKMTISPYTVEDSGTLRILSSAEPGVRSTGLVFSSKKKYQGRIWRKSKVYFCQENRLKVKIVLSSLKSHKVLKTDPFMISGLDVCVDVFISLSRNDSKNNGFAE